MILIPISTDAPIYHRPIGTVALIAVNIAVYMATGSDIHQAINQYGLHHGTGFTPIQWITSNFIHGGVLHLIGNLIFLWGFGLIVEGKLGWMQFIPLYLGMGALECILEQAVFANSDGISFGASSIIFSLMVISLIWAPQNELTVFYWLFFRFAGVFDISIVMFALLNLMISVVTVVLLQLMQSPPGGEILHLLGAAIGAGIGFLYLKLKLVDCEGWDILSVMTGNTPTSEAFLSEAYQEARRRRSNVRKAKRNRTDSAKPRPKLSNGSTAEFTRLLEEGKATAAFAELEKIRHRKPDWSPPVQQLLDLARGLRTASKMRESVAMYEAFLQQKPDYPPAALELAEIFVFVNERPSAAMRLLQSCDLTRLSEKQSQRHAQASRHAQAMIDDGVLEIDFQQ